ncbi:MAG: DNA alkylation repair protein [Alphaproteobacteria bacterium]|nr:DNA alkylation repair protein [Rickettsiales bacterium]
MDLSSKIKSSILELSNPEKITVYQNFFKIGKGQYSEGDIFIGTSVPNIRKLALLYSKESNYDIIEDLLYSKIHEERMCGLFILVYQYQDIQKGKNLSTKDKKEKQKPIIQFYLKHVSQSNNWDLIDCVCPKLLGHYILTNHEDKEINSNLLISFSKSDNLWERRISIVSTFEMIRQNQFNLTLQIAGNLLNDKHDLIHKATGWILREIGKRNQEVEICFLNKHYKQMPRTMLRYAIEKFDEKLRQRYLKGLVKKPLNK